MTTTLRWSVRLLLVIFLTCSNLLKAEPILVVDEPSSLNQVFPIFVVDWAKQSDMLNNDTIIYLIITPFTYLEVII